MSVRDGLLAILTLGPAYGLQLHSELLSRAPHRSAINVGQIYGTLERLSRNGVVDAAGTTSDGLPLYRLTTKGAAAARTWMTEAEIASLPDWAEMLDQVLVTSSIDPSSAMLLTRGYRGRWQQILDSSRVPEAEESRRHDEHLAMLANEALALAALAWLGSASAALADYDTARSLSPVRPKRGRRPKGVAQRTTTT